MPPIEIRPTPRVGAIDAWAVRSTGKSPERPQAATGEHAMVRSDALDPGEAPIDTDRVATIRKAIEDGSYPVVPARIADAIIAAGLLLRTPK